MRASGDKNQGKLERYHLLGVHINTCFQRRKPRSFIYHTIVKLKCNAITQKRWGI